MLKKEIVHNGVIIRQYQLGYISIKMEYYLDDDNHQFQRTLLAINVYVFIIENTIWILDTGYNDDFNISFIQSKMSTDFSEIIAEYQNYKDVNIIVSHFHPDHCGGLIKYFDQIQSRDWRLFYNQKDFKSEYYHNYSEIEDWLNTAFKSYQNKFHINRQPYFKMVCSGGHTPDHMVLSYDNHKLIYPSDIIPTVYHIKNLPTGEKNFDNSKFVENRLLVTQQIELTKSILLLPHAPNSGFHYYA